MAFNRVALLRGLWRTFVPTQGRGDNPHDKNAFKDRGWSTYSLLDWDALILGPDPADAAAAAGVAKDGAVAAVEVWPVGEITISPGGRRMMKCVKTGAMELRKCR